MEPTSSGRQSDGNQRKTQETSGTPENGSRVSRSQSSERPQSIQRTSGNFSRSPWGGNPLDTMARLSREMDQLIDAFFGGRRASPGLAEVWSPRIDVRERGDNLVISVELPGVQREAIQIEATNEGIAISGELRESREENEDKRGYRFAERTYGSFYRNIPLPEGAQVEQAKATMRDGVLEITVPVKQTAQRSRIEISG